MTGKGSCPESGSTRSEYYEVKFAGVGPRVYVGMPLLLSRKGAVVRRAGHLLFNGPT